CLTEKAHNPRLPCRCHLRFICAVQRLYFTSRSMRKGKAKNSAQEVRRNGGEGLCARDAGIIHPKEAVAKTRPINQMNKNAMPSRSTITGTKTPLQGLLALLLIGVFSQQLYAASATITVDYNQRKQTVAGFGASIT